MTLFVEITTESLVQAGMFTETDPIIATRSRPTRASIEMPLEICSEIQNLDQVIETFGDKESKRPW